mgnify:CR=1 FL=1
MVLPDPTSPWSSLFIEYFFFISNFVSQSISNISIHFIVLGIQNFVCHQPCATSKRNYWLDSVTWRDMCMTFACRGQGVQSNIGLFDFRGLSDISQSIEISNILNAQKGKITPFSIPSLYDRNHYIPPIFKHIWQPFSTWYFDGNIGIGVHVLR